MNAASPSARFLCPLVRFVQGGGCRGQVVIERERDSPGRAKALGDLADMFRRIRNGRLQPRELVVEVGTRWKRQRVRFGGDARGQLRVGDQDSAGPRRHPSDPANCFASQMVMVQSGSTNRSMLLALYSANAAWSLPTMVLCSIQLHTR